MENYEISIQQREADEVIVRRAKILDMNENGLLPYKDKWFIKIESDADQVEFADLLDYSDYKEEIE